MLGATLGGLHLPGCASPRPLPIGELSAAPIDHLRIGFVGVGGMGSAHIRNLLRIEGCEITAVCDINSEAVARVQQWCREAGQAEPTGYTRGEHDFERLCAEEDLDLVYNATPWRWHVPICLAAMESGKHAAVEVPAALTVDDCWQLVETSERLGLAHRDAGAQHGASGRPRRAAPQGLRLPPRPARDQVLRQWRRALAPGALPGARRQPLPHPRPGPRGPVHGHQPLWRTVGKAAKGAGHGGMDYLEDYRPVQCLRRGEALDMDVP